MKPFNLEKALAGEKVVTRTGKKVTSLHLLDEPIDYPLVGRVEGELSIKTFTADGSFYTDKSHSDFDLFMAPKTTTLCILRHKKTREYRLNINAECLLDALELLGIVTTVEVEE